MPDPRDYEQFLRELPPDEFRRFVSAFGGDAKGPDEIVAWVTSAEREKRVCDKIRQMFGAHIPTASDRQEEIARASAEATRRQAAAAERANETAERALRVAERSMHWTKVAAVVAGLAFLLGVIGLLK